MGVSIVFTVDEISFLNDFTLFRDSAGTNPPELIQISDPVWRRVPERNEPVAYKKNTPYKMDALVKCSVFPYHDFQYKIKATEMYEDRWYNTTEYNRRLEFTNRDTVKNIVPHPSISGNFPDSVGILDELRFHWAINKTPDLGDYGYEFINPSGPHKIFLTYDKPRVDTLNTLALDKICRYAENLFTEAAIAESTVTGVYKEGWDYDPERLFIFADPLNVIRQRTGLCSDYANLLTVLYRSVGISSNSTVIFNMQQGTGGVYRLFWTYTEDPRNPPCCVLTKKLAACDDPVPQYWAFWYHAVSHVNNYYCDATLNLFRPVTDYGTWWRYYLYPKSIVGPWLDNEPPRVPPDYRDVDYLIDTLNHCCPNVSFLGCCKWIDDKGF